MFFFSLGGCCSGDVVPTHLGHQNFAKFGMNDISALTVESWNPPAVGSELEHLVNW